MRRQDDPTQAHCEKDRHLHRRRRRARFECRHPGRQRWSASTAAGKLYGIRDGYNGLMMPEQFIEGGLVRLTRDRVRGITHLGGTIIGTTNRGNPFSFPIRMPDGTITEGGPFG